MRTALHSSFLHGDCHFKFSRGQRYFNGVGSTLPLCATLQTNSNYYSVDNKTTRCHFYVTLYFFFTSCSTCKGEIKDNIKVTSSWFLIHTELRCTVNHKLVIITSIRILIRQQAPAFGGWRADGLREYACTHSNENFNAAEHFNTVEFSIT